MSRTYRRFDDEDDDAFLARIKRDIDRRKRKRMKMVFIQSNEDYEQEDGSVKEDEETQPRTRNNGARETHR